MQLGRSVRVSVRGRCRVVSSEEELFPLIRRDSWRGGVVSPRPRAAVRRPPAAGTRSPVLGCGGRLGNTAKAVAEAGAVQRRGRARRSSRPNGAWRPSRRRRCRPGRWWRVPSPRRSRRGGGRRPCCRPAGRLGRCGCRGRGRARRLRVRRAAADGRGAGGRQIGGEFVPSAQRRRRGGGCSPPRRTALGWGWR